MNKPNASEALNRYMAAVLRPSALHDPAFAEAARSAAARGVEFYAIRVEPTEIGYRFVDEISVDLKPYDTRPLEAFRSANSTASGWTRRAMRKMRKTP